MRNLYDSVEETSWHLVLDSTIGIPVDLTMRLRNGDERVTINMVGKLSIHKPQCSYLLDDICYPELVHDYVLCQEVMADDIRNIDISSSCL
eukprot:SAG11_NODE_98_length_16927_cov_35.166211_11_plen_91_part_00